MSRRRSFRSIFSNVSRSSSEDLLCMGFPDSMHGESIHPNVVHCLIGCYEVQMLVSLIEHREYILCLSPLQGGGMWAVGSRLQSHLGHLELFVQLLNGRGLGDICRVSKMQHLVVGGETTIEELVPTSSRAREGRTLNKMAESLLSNKLEDLWLNPITQLLDWFRLEHVLIQQLTILLRLRYLLVAEIKQLLLEDLEAGQRGASIEEHRGDLFGHYSDHLLKIEDGGSHLAPGLEEELDGDAEHLLEGLLAPDENGNVLIAYLGGLFADAKQLTQDLGEGDAGVSKGALAVRVGKEQSGEVGKRV